MPRPLPVLKTLEDLPDCRAIRIAKANLISCRCLVSWKQLMRLSNEGKNLELEYISLGYCVAEQCWNDGDIDFQLSESDKSLPFPKSVRRCLINKLKNAKLLKQDAFERINEQRSALEAGHG